VKLVGESEGRSGFQGNVAIIVTTPPVVARLVVAVSLGWFPPTS